MVLELRQRHLERGLRLHPSKCKAQSNCLDWDRRGSVLMEEWFSLFVLEEEGCLEVLGTSLSLLDVTKPDFNHIIAVGWRKFWAMKRLLLNGNVSLKKRLHLFDSNVGRTVLYASHAWTPREEEVRTLRAAQNTMLRRICQHRRAPEERWHEWIQRVTAKARSRALEAGVRDWVHAHAQKKWHWPGHASRRSFSTWVRKVTCWRDSDWTKAMTDCSWRPRRPSRRRWMKWEDPIRRYAAETGVPTWSNVTNDRTAWKSMAEGFAAWFSKSSCQM